MSESAESSEAVRNSLYPCSKCDFVGVGERKLQQHMRSHRQNLLCGTCGFVAEHQIELYR